MAYGDDFSRPRLAIEDEPRRARKPLEAAKTAGCIAALILGCLLVLAVAVFWPLPTTGEVSRLEEQLAAHIKAHANDEQAIRDRLVAVDGDLRQIKAAIGIYNGELDDIQKQIGVLKAQQPDSRWITNADNGFRQRLESIERALWEGK